MSHLNKWRVPDTPSLPLHKTHKSVFPLYTVVSQPYTSYSHEKISFSSAASPS